MKSLFPKGDRIRQVLELKRYHKILALTPLTVKTEKYIIAKSKNYENFNLAVINDFS